MLNVVSLCVCVSVYVCVCVCVCVLMVCHLLYRTPLGDITNAAGSRAKRHRFPQSVLFTVGTADSVCVCVFSPYCSVEHNTLHEFHVCFMRLMCYLCTCV